MDTTVYSNVSTTAYVRPTEQGPYVQHGPGNSAAAQSNASAIHKEGRRIYDPDNNLDAALKQEIITTVENTHLSAKTQRYMGFHIISAKKLVGHLMERYKEIRTSDLEACGQALAEPIEVDLTIDIYLQQVEDIIQFSQDGKTPFTSAQTAQTSYHAIKNTGIYSLVFKEWRKK